jgi:hypothetical protein
VTGRRARLTLLRGPAIDPRRWIGGRGAPRVYEAEAQRIDVLTPLFHAGLTQGERCVYVARPAKLAAVADVLERRLAPRLHEKGQLLLLPAPALDLPASGPVDRFFADSAREAEAAGYAGVRIAVEMSALLERLAPRGLAA